MMFTPELLLNARRKRQCNREVARISSKLRWGNDGFASGLLLDESLEAGEKFWSQMGERLGKSQNDIEVIDPLELDACHPAVLIIHALLQKL